MTPMSCVSYGELILVPNKPTTDKAYMPTVPLPPQLPERYLLPHAHVSPRVQPASDPASIAILRRRLADLQRQAWTSPTTISK